MGTMESRVVVIGGGVTGCSVLRDLAMRGIDAVLCERGNPAEGTTGRFHGLLHSGGRYVVEDPTAAKECVQENAILRRIAGQAIEDTGGLFVVLDDADEAFLPQFIEGCKACRIPHRVLSAERALAREPALSPWVRRAVVVPDGSFDAARVCLSSIDAARALGSRLFVFAEVTDILVQAGRAVGVQVRDLTTGTDRLIHAEFVVNATGPWAGQVSHLAGIHIPMKLDRGTMVVIDGRPVQHVINRCRRPSDGDIVVPVRGTVVLGTTSEAIEDPDVLPVPPDEVELLLREGVEMVPSIEGLEVKCAYTGVRPLYRPSGAAEGQAREGRELSRTHVVLDHGARDGVDGLITVTGGKATTARLMAEETVDLVARKLGVQRPCRTDEVPLLRD